MVERWHELRGRLLINYDVFPKSEFKSTLSSKILNNLEVVLPQGLDSKIDT